MIDAIFQENFKSRAELGASVSVWKNGEEILSLHHGFADANRSVPWTAETLVPIWSSTKGVAAVTFLHALQTFGIRLDARVGKFWPEFEQAGKSEITLAQVLSHQSGLPGLDDPLPDALDFEAVTNALARQTPFWIPGTSHGYHARTFGYLLDAILLRISGGETVGKWLQTHLAGPLGLDVWIGLPPELFPRVATLQAAKGKRFPNLEYDAFYKALSNPQTLASRTMKSPSGLSSVATMNSPEAHAASLPAFSGIATARGLAKFYAILADQELRSTLFEPWVYEALTTRLVDGLDEVMQIPTAFGAGVMLDPLGSDGSKMRSIFGPSKSAFGHPGAGGSLAFADPERGIGFAYVMNQMEVGLLPNPKALDLVAAL